MNVQTKWFDLLYAPDDVMKMQMPFFNKRITDEAKLSRRKAKKYRHNLADRFPTKQHIFLNLIERNIQS